MFDDDPLIVSVFVRSSRRTQVYNVSRSQLNREVLKTLVSHIYLVVGGRGGGFNYVWEFNLI